MSVGLDIKKAFQDVGTRFTIKRGNSLNLSGEYLVYEIDLTNTRPFARGYIFSASLAYDSDAIEGDVLLFEDGRRFLLPTRTPEQFNNETIIYETVLLGCNVISGEIQRSSEEVWDGQTYRKTQNWVTIETNVDALIVESFSGNVLDEKEEFGVLTISKKELYISKTRDIKVLDRFQVVSGEFYKVNVLNKDTYSGVLVVEISEDNR